MKRVMAIVVTTVLAAVGLVLSAGAATAQVTGSVNVTLPDSGTIAARGALVRLPLEITCAFTGRFESADVWVDLRQAQGRSVARGSGYARLSSTTCDGTAHEVIVAVLADNRPFRKGQAAGVADANVCFSDTTTGEWRCVSDRDGPDVIRLRRA